MSLMIITLQHVVGNIDNSE